MTKDKWRSSNVPKAAIRGQFGVVPKVLLLSLRWEQKWKRAKFSVKPVRLKAKADADPTSRLNQMKN